MIEFNSVHKDFSSTSVLRGLTFTAQDGRVTGFVGPNGSGKSTAFKILLGLLEANRGEATVNGVPFAEHTNPGRVLGAYLGPEHIPGEMTGYTFLRYSADLIGVGDSTLDDYLQAVGLGDAADLKVKRYSLGMRQRLGVAAAFVGKPHNLILDEPVNGLDIEGVRWLRDYLRSAAAQGRCVLLSSHVLSELQLVADDVVMLAQGRCVESGALGQLRTHDQQMIDIVSADDRRLAAEFTSRGIQVTGDAGRLQVQGVPFKQVAAVVGASHVEVSSMSLATRDLEDVYLDNLQTTTSVSWQTRTDR